MSLQSCFDAPNNIQYIQKLSLLIANKVERKIDDALSEMISTEPHLNLVPCNSIVNR